MDDHETTKLDNEVVVIHDKKLNNYNKLYYCYEFLKRTVQFVFSVSVFCFFVWYSSGFSVLPQSFNAYFSTCLLSMLAHTLERKYMFLIFNVILAFLFLDKTSLFTSSPHTSTPFEYAQDNEVVFPLPSFQYFPADQKASPIVVEQELIDQQVLKSTQEAFHDRVSELADQEETEGGENEAAAPTSAAAEEEYDEELGETGSGVLMVTPDDDELADNKTMATNELEMANTEELNRKFEEFIRKMKEEIRIEAQAPPIAV